MRNILVAVVLIAFVAAPASARGEWYDLYEDGLEAIARGEHVLAVGFIERALEIKPRSGYLRTYGNNYLRYAPHFQLGVAFHGAGDCLSAQASFAASRSRGETDEVPELAARLAALDNDCDLALAPAPVETPPHEPEPVESRPLIDRDLLERGLASYLAGEFDASIGLFESLAGGHPDSAQMRLLAGMAHHGAWIAGGEVDGTQLEQARASLQAAVRLDPGLVPDPALCPPRVAALFRSLR